MLMRKRQSGVTLIEVGITLAVTTIGLLGLTAGRTLLQRQRKPGSGHLGSQRPDQPYPRQRSDRLHHRW